MTFKTITIVLICFNLFTDCSQAGKVRRSVENNSDASGDNPVTENEQQTSTAEKNQRNPSSRKLNEMTRTNSGEDDVATNQGQQETENGKEEGEKEEGSGVQKRALPAIAMSLLKNPKVQEAVIEKGIEVAGKLVDKQLKIIDEAQEKAENFLKKEIKLDIEPDKSWATESMYVPPGYHFQSSITDEESASSKEAPDVPYVYPAGIGSVMMNGCYGKNYSSTDPCYNSRANSAVCWNQIDGAAFLGVGFDGRGKYSPESRKMSIVQRNCKNKATYDGFDVPDTMNVHGIYDTSASMYTFQGQEEYSTFLQQEAGVSGSYFGFYAGVKEAWGSSSAETKDSFLALLDVNIERYEIFMDEVKPSDLSLNFLREFMELPLSYYSPGAPIKYQEFVERWGTHYIKSAKFGGQLEIRKTMDKQTAQSKTHFSMKMEAEYKSLFASVGASASVEKGYEDKSATQTTSTSVMAQGGSHEVASILSDVYSPTFKTEFKHWLTSIPSYPKPFKFRMGPIADLVNFRAADLFPDETVNWGCEGYVTALKSERNEDGELVKYYEITEGDEVKKKVYCPFDSRGGLEQAITRRRSSLHRAIEVYMEEGTISISDFDLQCPEGESVTETEAVTEVASSDNADTKDVIIVKDVPKWKSMTTTKMPFKVIIDMKEDLKDLQNGDVVIPKNMARHIRFLDNRWFTDDEKKVVHLYNGFNNGGSGDPKNRKISVLGLVLSFEEKTGRLVLTDSDFQASKKIFPDLRSSMKGSIIGQVEADQGKAAWRRSKLVDEPPLAPKINTCKVMFSNALRFDPTKGKCLHFTAITEGTIYVMFAVSPAKPNSQYVVRIANDRVDIYKGTEAKVYVDDESAVGIGTKSVHQSYFVCVTEEPNKAVRIEYGKSPGSSDAGDVFLSFGDVEKEGSKPLSVRFYAFGIEDVPVKIMDAHLLQRQLTETSCKGETREDHPTGLCAEKCHITCDPTAGCTGPADTECKACRMAIDTATGRCLDHCPADTFLTSEEVCRETFEINGNGFTTQTEIDFDTDMPPISAFTVSFWVKLSGWAEGISPGFYFHSKTLTMYLDFYKFEPSSSGIAYRVWIRDVSRWVKWPKEFMDNPTWHFITTTWNGMNDVLTVYVDGVQKRRDSGYESNYVLSFSGGGRLGLSSKTSVPIRWTSFNMWDRELDADVIAEHAKSCNGAIGNVKEWYDVWPKVEKESNYYTKPSTCSAPPIRSPLAEESGTSADELQSSGKSLFAKYHKRKSSIKDASKTHH
ncbi:uncharacterized protein LOC144643147 isoform X2 [Oculina patagonica]